MMWTGRFVLAVVLVCGCGVAEKKKSQGGREPEGGGAGAPGTLSEHESYRVQAVWGKGPRANDYSDVTLQFTEAHGENPLGEIDLRSVQPWMPVHGHPAATKKMKTAPHGGGTFAVTGIWFQMSGAWVLKVTADNGSGDDLAEISFDVP